MNDRNILIYSNVGISGHEYIFINVSTPLVAKYCNYVYAFSSKLMINYTPDKR